MKKNSSKKQTLVKICFFILFPSIMFGYSSEAINAYAVEIYDKQNKENIQGIAKTKYDYNGEVFVKIYAFGKFFEIKPNVKVGSSIGSFISQEPIAKNGLIIGYEILFKFTTIQSGYLEVYIGQKLFSRSVFVR